MNTKFTWKEENLYKEHYKQNPNYGSDGNRHQRTINCIINKFKVKSVLDYGCGLKHTLLNSIIARNKNIKAVGYDPGVTDEQQNNVLKNAIDFSFQPDLLISNDCLEHVPEDELKQCWDIFLRLNPKYIFLGVSTRPAVILLPDGSNAHKTVKEGIWWESEINKNLTNYNTTFIAPFFDYLYNESLFFCKKV